MEEATVQLVEHGGRFCSGTETSVKHGTWLGGPLVRLSPLRVVIGVRGPTPHFFHEGKRMAVRMSKGVLPTVVCMHNKQNRNK